MDKQIMASKLVDMATNRYAVAVLKDGEIHYVIVQYLVFVIFIHWIN